MEDNVKNAIEVLTKALRADKSEGSYYYSWQANIAMAFQDAYGWVMKGSLSLIPPTAQDLHEISNKAAKNFLDLLIAEPEVDTQIPPTLNS